MKTVKKILTLASCLSILASCQNTPTKTTTTVETTPKKDTIKVEPPKFYDKPTFLFTSKMDAEETPHATISYAFGNLVEKLDTSVTGAFHLLEKEEKKQKKLPKSYIQAASAFWAGLEVTYVIDSTAKGYLIKRQYQDEQGSGKEPFELVKTYPKTNQ